ncbi:hypothetical protein K523DRAFT_345355 [Schizophyllum commune Tattone D]|nr:hypothetical protein K523DRAFT_345355 [Schizophyllum commune Tattone D]
MAPSIREDLLPGRTRVQQQADILDAFPPPDHWSAYGHAGLEPVWAAVRLEEEAGDGSFWEARLLLASAATFLTTQPPRDEILNYTRRGPYICLVASFGLLIGGIIVGGACVLVTSKVQAYWSEKVLYADRFHVYCTLIMLSYPFFSIGIATLFLAFGKCHRIACSPHLTQVSFRPSYRRMVRQ